MCDDAPTSASKMPEMCVIGETPWQDEMNAAMLYFEIAKTVDLPFDLAAFFKILHDRSMFYVDKYAPAHGDEWKRKTKERIVEATRNAEALLAKMELLIVERSSHGTIIPQTSQQ
jgi:hypothetical protein